MRQLPFVGLALVLAALACDAGGAGTGPVATSAMDPEAVRAELAPPVSGVVWKRTIGDVEIVGVTDRADAAEVELIAAAVGELPTELVEAGEMRALVRAVEADAEAEPVTLAVARGPDIYLLDLTFASSPPPTRLAMAGVLAHELTHTAQFADIRPDYLAGLEGRDLATLDVTAASELVQDFARAAGWRSDDGTWSLPDPSGTTPYGATSPAEDMAESVAVLALGRPWLISPERIAWVEDWLGVAASDLAAGKPWAPPGSVELASRQPLYDEDKVGAIDAAHVEPLYWALPAGSTPAADLAAEAGAQLRQRGLTGTLEPVADDRLPRFGGRFVRSDGVSYWVELWDFRSADIAGDIPEQPVLTYVMLW